MTKSPENRKSSHRGISARSNDEGASATPNDLSTRDAARYYIGRGYAPIPVPASSKAPINKGWPALRVAENEVRAHFTNGDNIGLLLGEPSSWLVDVDIDANDGLAHAPRFFPKTGLISGRRSRPNSHYWYRSRVERTIHFEYQGRMLVEIRSTGAQTIVAPSHHPEGERVRWSSFGEPAEIGRDDLRAIAAAFAVAILLGQTWPKKGQRNKAALLIAGLLLPQGMDATLVRLIIETAARIAGDEEVQARMEAVRTTEERIRLGKPIAAEKAARTLFGDDVVTTIGRWISENERSGSSSEHAAEKESPSSTADKVIALASDFRFFCASSDGGQPFGSVTLDGRQETLRLGSSSFRTLLAHRYYVTQGRTPAKQAIEDAASVLGGIALHSRVREPIALRVAERDGVIYIDIGDEDRRVIVVSERGWTVTQSHPINFVRPSSMMPLPIPEPGGDLNALREFVNVETEEDWLMLISWLIFAFHPRGPYPVLSLSGGQGTAKSTTSNVLKMCSDPDQAEYRSAPRNPRDLAIAAHGNHVLTFDNMSSISKELSDSLCRLSTGGAFATRRLYTDDEESLFNATRPVILNGIPDLLGQPDLLDRAIHLVLPKIPASARKDVEQFSAEFESARPALFGAILDALAGVLRILPSVHMKRLPRMADFCRWSVALQRHLGLPSGSFIRAYSENRRASSMIALDESPLVRPIRYFLRKSAGQFEGPASELLRGLNGLTFKGIEDLRRSPDWPRRPNRLSGELRRIGPYLEEIGIKFERGRDAKDSVRNRFIILRWIKRPKITKRVADILDDEAPPLVMRGGRIVTSKDDHSTTRKNRTARAKKRDGRRKP